MERDVVVDRKVEIPAKRRYGAKVVETGRPGWSRLSTSKRPQR